MGIPGKRALSGLGERVLITGVAGFLGSRLAEELRSLDFEVVGIDDFSNGFKKNLASLAGDRGFKLIRGSILDDRAISRACRGVDSVFHMAAQPSVATSSTDPELDFKVNAWGTLKVLEGARRATASVVIFASSSTVYGEAPLPTPETHPLLPISNYGASKAVGEAYCYSYHSLYGLRTASLRYYNVYGPRSRKGVMFDLLKRLQENNSELEVLGTGDQLKDYLYLDDAIAATLLVASGGGLKGEAYNVGSGTSRSVKGLVRLMLGMLNLRGKTEVVYKGGLSWPGDVQRTRADIRKLRKLGFSAKVSLEEGLRRFLEWYQREYGPVVRG